MDRQWDRYMDLADRKRRSFPLSFRAEEKLDRPFYAIDDARSAVWIDLFDHAFMPAARAAFLMNSVEHPVVSAAGIMDNAQMKKTMPNKLENRLENTVPRNSP